MLNSALPTSDFRPPISKSVQWESNPHFRHGKAVGYHYIMDAFVYSIVKDHGSRRLAGLLSRKPASRVEPRA